MRNSGENFSGQKKGRILSYDFMKSVAVAGVIVGHSLALAAGMAPELAVLERYGTALMRPVVPIFIFLAGALYKPRQSMRETGLRLLRLVTPYLFFAAVFTLIYVLAGVKFGTVGYILRVLTGEIHPVYYYVFLMAEYTVLLFVLERIFGYERMTIPLFATMAVLSILHGNYSKEIFERIGLRESMTLFCTYRSPFLWGIFYAAGIVLGQYPNLRAKAREYKIWLRSIFAGLSLFYIVMVYFAIGDLDGLNSVITTLICFSAILCLLTIRVRSKGWLFLSRRSYTIYLAHVPFYYLMEQIWKGQEHMPAIIIILTNLAVMGGGAAAVCALGKAIFKNHSFYVIGS